MIRQRFVRTGSSASRIPERTAAPTAEEAVKKSALNDPIHLERLELRRILLTPPETARRVWMYGAI